MVSANAIQVKIVQDEIGEKDFLTLIWVEGTIIQQII